MTEKIQNYIKPILFSLLTLSIPLSCSDQLDLAPLDSFSSEAFWVSESNALLALAGVYKGNIGTGVRGANGVDWWSYSALVFLEFATDNAYDRRGDNAGWNRLSNGTMNSTNVASVRLAWQWSYQRIARSNYFIENVEQVPADAAAIARMAAEARFIRATQYYYLSQSFGAVPLVTRTLGLDEANTVEKTPVETVVQFVIDELTAIVPDLPQDGDMPDSEYGRASKQAALAFLGRMQLADHRYADAAATYKQIIDYGDHDIHPDYAGLFNGMAENTAENIFTNVHIADIAGGATNGILQHTLPAIKGGWHIVNPLGDLVENYDFADGTPFSFDDPRFDPTDFAANRDPRLDYNVYGDNSSFAGLTIITHPDSTNSIDRLTTNRQATRTGFGMRKFMDETFNGDVRNSGGDIPIIRYAEVLLSYLEAKLEAGDAIDQQLLDETINKVRARPSVNMPPITETNPEALRPILRKERRNELAFEGIRYWDLKRWGIMAEVLNGRFFGHSFPDAQNLRQDGDYEDPYDRWFVTKKNFREGTDENWFIPQQEIDINPRLGQ